MQEPNEAITPRQFLASDGVGDWRLLGSDGACAYFRTRSFAESVRFVQAIAAIPGADSHPPRIDIRRGGVTVSLITVLDKHFGMSTRDIEIAREVSAVARRAGLTADLASVQSLLVIPGALDTRKVMPFWRAVLGYEPRPDSPEEDLVDPQDRGPGFWFERMTEPRGDGGGAIHLAVWVPYEQARSRIDAALAAGGRLVRDEFAPAWWTLADPAGNEVDIATITATESGRD